MGNRADPASARDHGDPVALALRDGLLDSVRVLLVGTQLWVVVRDRGDPLALGVEVASQQLGQGARRVELGDPARAVQRVPHVVEPRHPAAGRVDGTRRPPKLNGESPRPRA